MHLIEKHWGGKKTNRWEVWLLIPHIPSPTPPATSASCTVYSAALACPVVFWVESQCSHSLDCNDAAAPPTTHPDWASQSPCWDLSCGRLSWCCVSSVSPPPQMALKRKGQWSAWLGRRASQPCLCLASSSRYNLLHGGFLFFSPVQWDDCFYTAEAAHAESE